ncbi:hypothetical protein QFZ79_001372 [Arthrobacter sp. V4I6]|uniref:hypothetical protein n=1 Tax=unclassified Arthrobacter TaxID=235627 RepID=UPI002783FAE4|nr:MULTISPECIES: hypothetical protein [unclassified Arthrobacter]MDQ0823627.1 hypothetical protein [Arthrobacter sp. V1I7]MDQ0853261.1 hypothetical protein [Arthrobacter sp. V4I6]
MALGSVYARTDTQIETTLDGKLQTGDYTVTVTLTDAPTKASATGTIPFTVADQALAKSGSAGPVPLPQIIQDAGTGPWPWLAALLVLAVLAVILLLRRSKRNTTEQTAKAIAPGAAGNTAGRGDHRIN